jgi:hypothetical protein
MFRPHDSVVDLEAAQFHDIIQVDVTETYEGLSEKVFSCIKHLQDEYSNTFDFLLKTDQDVFLRFDVLIPEL